MMLLFFFFSALKVYFVALVLKFAARVPSIKHGVHERVFRAASCGLGVLSSFVIASCANEEKLPHPELAALLINPSC